MLEEKSDINKKAPDSGAFYDLEVRTKAFYFGSTLEIMETFSIGSVALE